VRTEEAETGLRRRIGRYLVTGRIGRGGMGMVYRGLDETLEREVAIKTLTVEGTLDEESRRRFQIEAKAAAKLQHPNIITVFELGEDRGVPYIAMEMLPGVDLESLVRSGEEMLLEEKLDIVIQVGRGLAYAHEHRIVHRDIKPSNIRLLDDGAVKIMDFGIAKLGGTELTKAGMMVGTVHYMSPEQVRGKLLDGRSDVFSLGVILYELLAGQRPFKGQGATEVLFKIVHDDPPPLDPGALGGVSLRLLEIVSRALAKNPDARYPSAAAFADDVALVLEDHEGILGPLATSPATLESIAAARRLVKEGRLPEAEARLREIVAANPWSVEGKRGLRTALREAQQASRSQEPPVDDYAELEATFKASPTRRTADTAVQPTAILNQAPAAPSRTGRGSWIALGGGGLLALAAALVLVVGGGKKELAKVGVPVPSEPRVTLIAQSVGLPVASDPAGAAVTLDGQRVKGVTPLVLTLDPGQPHVLAIALEGHLTQETRLVPGQTPAEIKVRLEPSGPLGTVVVASSYPMDVLWRGRLLAKDQASPRVSLPGGRQTLTLVATGLFLHRDLPVVVTGGAEVAAAAPGIGKVSIRSMPDNAQVFIDGTFVDYPPIHDKPVAAGPHTVSFKWPDGARSQETVEVARGASAFVTGRKD
jgi:predicted Ser/Thr protein kinase